MVARPRLDRLKDTLPRQAEVQGWCSAARSWAALYSCPVGELEETMDGCDLAATAEAAGSIEALQAQLEDADATSWLDELHRFLSATGFDDTLRRLKIVPDQNGRFSTLPLLHRDQDIPGELKEIAQLIGWDLRAELRDTSFCTLADEPGAGDFDSDLVIPKLIDRLHKRILRTSVLYTRAVPFDEFLPDEPLPEGDDGKVEHKVDGTVEVTDVAFLSGGDIAVLSRVRQSRNQAQLFWDFLTRWLAVEDAQGLQARESTCVCELPHRYYPAAWLVPLACIQWVPLERRRTDRATAHSLAKLVRDTGWPPDLLQTSPQVVALLKALRVGVPELIMELFATDDQERAALDEVLAQLLTSVGSANRLQVLAEDLQEDGELFEHLEERRQRRLVVRENQRLGALVEELVRESLEGESFNVQRTGVGSDFAIQPRPTAEDEQLRLELTREGRRWLVEIKSARDDSVTMTSVQAWTSVEHDSRYLLCVVPISDGPEDPDSEAVRRRMRFVDGIGARLAGICADLDEYESIRDRVTVEDTGGLRLELDSGSPRIRIGSTVWETGFGLDDLFSRLTATDAAGDGTR